MMIDETRKLVMVQAIIDTTHFRGAWRGQCYEATAIPDTSSLSVGDSVFCHVMPGSTQLLALVPGGEVLWFTPGIPTGAFEPGGGAFQGELWKCTGLTATYVLSTPHPDEYITCLWWAFNKLWMATWDAVETRVYVVDRTAGTAAEVASWIRNLGPVVNPVVDVAIFRNSDDTKQVLYLHCAGATSIREVYVRVMDPDTYVHTVVFSYPPFAYTGGIAVAHEGQTPGGDPGVPALVCFDGYRAYVTYDGIVWALDQDLDADFDTADAFDLISDTYDGIVSMADQGGAPDEKKVMRRVAPGAWVEELGGVSGSRRLAGIALTQQHSGDSPLALWLQCWGWDFLTDTPEVWTKPVGAGWGMDWVGPCNITGYGDGWVGVWSQGICGFAGTVYALFFRYADPPLYAGEVVSMLFTRVRTPLGYTWEPVVHGPLGVSVSWQLYEATPLLAYNLAMCVAPNTYRNPDEV